LWGNWGNCCKLVLEFPSELSHLVIYVITLCNTPYVLLVWHSSASADFKKKKSPQKWKKSKLDRHLWFLLLSLPNFF
jgi:hypothetical protein